MARPANGDEDDDAPRPAAVSAHPFDFTDRPWSIDGVLGFGTPVGLAGVVLQYDLTSWLSVGGGAGTAYVLSTRGEEVRLGRGVALSITLAMPLHIRIAANPSGDERQGQKL